MTNVLKGDKGDLVTDSHSILARRRKHFSQKFHVHRNIDARQTEIKTAELLVPGPSAFEFQMAIETLNRHEPPGIDQIPDELFKQGVAKFALRSINVLILFGMKRNCLRSGRSRSLYLSIRRVMKHTVVIIEAYYFCKLRKKFYLTSSSQG